MRPIGKAGKKNDTPWYVWLIIGAVVLQATGMYDFTELLPAGDSDDGGDDGVPANFASCPTDGDSTIIIDVRNELNTTATEEFDVTAYLYDSAGALVATVTDTTNPTGTTVNCGDSYVGKVIAAGADNSHIVGKDYGDVIINADGTFSFDAERSTHSIGLRGREHGVLQFKAYDNDAAGWMCNSDDTCTDYEADGTTFESSVNGTALAIGVGGILDVTVYVQGTSTDTDFQDAYTLVLIEGGTSALTIWNDPNLVSWNGAPLTEVSASLTHEEQKQFNGYEWVYRIDGPIEDVVNKLNVQMSPASGQNPTQDLEIDFASAGKYLSTDGQTVKEGAAQDDTSFTVTQTVMDVTLDLS